MSQPDPNPPTTPTPRPAGRWVQLKLATFIALRIARSKRSTSLSLVTLISIVGIACGVLALTVVLSVTNGFQAAFQDRILGVFPHLIVTRASSIFRDYEPVLESILKTPGVVGATPLTGDEMMVAHGVFRGGATVQGVDLATVRGVLDIDRLMVEGRLDDLDETATIAPADDGLRLSEPVSGASLTLVHDGVRPLVLVDERTNPDAD
ncbi:MAG TPA: ABC transporter permease, partial [Myxococcota bacterium]|nr:ABC transporter permease [Myxococcota bacterium]